MASSSPQLPPPRVFPPDVPRPVAEIGQRVGSKAVRRLQARVMIAAGDLIAVVGGIGGVGVVRTAIGHNDEVGRVMFALVPLFFAVALYHHAYDRDVIFDWRCGYRRLVSALAVAFLALVGIAFTLKISAGYSRIIMLLGLLVSAVLLAGMRWATSRLSRLLLPDSVADVAILVCGPHEELKGILRGVAVIDVARLGLIPRLDDPEMLDRIGGVLRGCERVVVACTPDLRDAWTAVLKGLGVTVELLVPELEALGMLGTSKHGDHLTAVVAEGPLRPTDLALKRAFDLAAVLFLMPGLLVVTALVAIAIKLDDGGPIFFRQARMGHGNRLFAILKFRTMYQAAADARGTVSTNRNDPRVTRVGAILRRTSIDELPQFFNVLMGSMSIVGPRPHALGSLAGEALFWDADHRYWQRHVVKPGLTGLAQVRGFRGSTGATSDLRARVQADLEYIHGWTIWRDVRIALQTGGVLLHHNAY
jgi:exopolysaccharide biosynthesis polyprenyl glycosylphosphotransferase